MSLSLAESRTGNPRQANAANLQDDHGSPTEWPPPKKWGSPVDLLTGHAEERCSNCGHWWFRHAQRATITPEGTVAVHPGNCTRCPHGACTTYQPRPAASDRLVRPAPYYGQDTRQLAAGWAMLWQTCIIAVVLWLGVLRPLQQLVTTGSDPLDLLIPVALTAVGLTLLSLRNRHPIPGWLQLWRARRSQTQLLVLAAHRTGGRIEANFSNTSPNDSSIFHLDVSVLPVRPKDGTWGAAGPRMHWTIPLPSVCLEPGTVIPVDGRVEPGGWVVGITDPELLWPLRPLKTN